MRQEDRLVGLVWAVEKETLRCPAGRLSAANLPQQFSHVEAFPMSSGGDSFGTVRLSAGPVLSRVGAGSSVALSKSLAVRFRADHQCPLLAHAFENDRRHAQLKARRQSTS